MALRQIAYLLLDERPAFLNHQHALQAPQPAHQGAVGQGPHAGETEHLRRRVGAEGAAYLGERVPHGEDTDDGQGPVAALAPLDGVIRRGLEQLPRLAQLAVQAVVTPHHRGGQHHPAIALAQESGAKGGEAPRLLDRPFA